MKDTNLSLFVAVNFETLLAIAIVASFAQAQNATRLADSYQVVIGDENAIDIESRTEDPTTDVETTTTAINLEEDKTESNNLDAALAEEILKDFESVRYDTIETNHSIDKQPSNYVSDDDRRQEEFNYGELTTPIPLESFQEKQEVPSFSKIPDYIVHQLIDDNVQLREDEIPIHERPGKNAKNPLIVPIGSRVHTVKIKDYSKPDSSEVVDEYYDRYEPNIIELPSSQPVLPIVFNFRTQTSPIIATQSRVKSASQPTVEFLQTNEPPHYRQHVVHKPIIQDLREVIIPYRYYVREIKPVNEYKQTYIPTYRRPSYRHPYQASPKYRMKCKVPCHKHKYQQMVMANRYHMVSNNLAPYFTAQAMKQHRPVNKFNHRNYQGPYRVQDLYKKISQPNFLPQYDSFNHYKK